MTFTHGTRRPGIYPKCQQRATCSASI